MDKKGKGDKRRQKETLQLWFRSVTSDSLNSLRRVQASSNILLKNNVISHLYVQITWSLVRIYLGLDSRNANLWVLGCVQISDPIKALIEGRMKERGKEQRGMKSRMEGRSVFWGPVVQRLQTPSPTLLVPSHLSPFGQTSISLFFFFLIFFLFLLPLLKPLFPSQMSFSLCHSFVFSQTLHSTYNSHPIRSIKQKRKRKLQFPHKWLNNLNQFFVDCTKSILEQSFSIFRL